jgi:plastocyanin
LRVERPEAVAAFLLDQPWFPLAYSGIAQECVVSSAAARALTRRRGRRVPKRKRRVTMRMKGLFVALVLAGAPALASAQHVHSPADAAVDFGVSPASSTGVLVPIGPLPCLQTGAIGGPADPCSYKLHVLTPEETSVAKGGEVTFQIHGGGHGFAIYKVSTDTTRAELGQFLCAGADPASIANPGDHVCNLSASNANATHIVMDGGGDVVLVAQANLTNQHPDNRVWSEPGRFVSSGGMQFLNGGTTPANGQLLTYRFEKTGRYLVLCINRVHFLNDWMFGFVNVTETAAEKE